MTLFEHKDRIVKDLIKPLFKTAGFSVSGTTYVKKEKDFLKVFNIQSSGFNLVDNVSFYLNMGILFPVWFEIRKEQFPKHPKEYDCQFRIRPDSLLGRNQSYHLTPTTDIREFELLVMSDIENHILPFFEKYSTLDDCMSLSNDFPRSPTDCSPFIALTMIKDGLVEKGDEILDQYLAKAPPWWKQELWEFRQKLD
jgi:hypothetical protein